METGRLAHLDRLSAVGHQFLSSPFDHANHIQTLHQFNMMPVLARVVLAICDQMYPAAVVAISSSDPLLMTAKEPFDPTEAT